MHLYHIHFWYTGKPKGVCVGQESLLNLLWHNDYYQVNESDIAGKI